MSATAAPPATGTITRGPSRYNTVMAVCNRHLQIFWVDGVARPVRIDGIRPLVLTDDPCQRWILTVFCRETERTETWYYDSEELTGSTKFTG